MRMKQLIWLVIMLFLPSGCYGEMTGTVVDAVTGKPIEGAVVLVEWTITKGAFGLHSTESYKVIETTTDKEGQFTVGDVANPSVDPPSLTIYKAGYVAWNNEFIFPGNKKRTDFAWKDGCMFKLEKFKEEYSHNEHMMFIRTAINSGMALNDKNLMRSSIEWEGKKALEERLRKR